MKCFICNQTLDAEETLVDHIQTDINDKQYGMNALTLAELLIDFNTRINKLEQRAPKEVKTERKYEKTSGSVRP